ncbi:MAG: hypothetical protein QNK03_21125 [Myxococcota bacterium]|nr:hypothetical protein [Myxococcota bacterium]
MPIPGRKLLGAALIAAFAALAVVQPTLSSAHALEHLETGGTTGPPAEAPSADPEAGAHCDLCLSLSQGRTALDSAGMQAQVCTPVVGRIAPVVPLLVPIRASRAPESPRAPPLG